MRWQICCNEEIAAVSRKCFSVTAVPEGQIEKRFFSPSLAEVGVQKEKTTEEQKNVL